MSFLQSLKPIERKLVYGVGAYGVVGFLYSAVNRASAKPEEKPAPAPAPAPAPKAVEAAPAPAPVVVHKPVATATPAASSPSFEGPNDPAVLFALQDIQTRLSLIEKALKL
uniref:Uncharacterized protein n=1 Tax=Mucochytrium quahogii TaxID=96639 RepID=A0A7S2R6S6_9STRA|mmetsp:Transcript_19040/g.31158  ORF Transcript_19040/g.31158 Transcript_19040/m.31158 type:complete len:111 (+) Transcript_19040:155-487(+)|eukprot:CAMPEP_0203749650 /NCGR_PEP_ID=MMETSP0098-20131031/4132_1 /ASSEMBLY_ACC=CAM_ASM_000208 /TAXON_ID=96639 /ORGANISM=" , Strain NY0313808BC1" /LENGTH=110 /DNA_ID=CAMNT_0050638741 /DNA_START=201 /DNA_END=533 /DNA_ORIENTATION=-